MIGLPPSEDGRHIAGDLRDVYVARNAVQGMDAVVHPAAMPYDAAPPDQVLAINVPGTLRRRRPLWSSICS